MSEEGRRFMWIMVFFDLPVQTPPERRRANHFRKFLLKDGYSMIQYSVYARICNGMESVEKHTKRLKDIIPPDGNIRVMQVTEQQYSRIQILVGKKKPFEKKNEAKQLCFF